MHILWLVTDNKPSGISGIEENDSRNHFMINLHEVWDLAGIELVTPGSAVRHVSAFRHVTDCATCPDMKRDMTKVMKFFSYSTQLSTKFILLINVKMPTIVGIYLLISMINTTP